MPSIKIAQVVLLFWAKWEPKIIFYFDIGFVF